MSTPMNDVMINHNDLHECFNPSPDTAHQNHSAIPPLDAEGALELDNFLNLSEAELAIWNAVPPTNAGQLDQHEVMAEATNNVEAQPSDAELEEMYADLFEESNDYFQHIADGSVDLNQILVSAPAHGSGHPLVYDQQALADQYYHQQPIAAPQHNANYSAPALENNYVPLNATANNEIGLMAGVNTDFGTEASLANNGGQQEAGFDSNQDLNVNSPLDAEGLMILQNANELYAEMAQGDMEMYFDHDEVDANVANDEQTIIDNPPAEQYVDDNQVQTYATSGQKQDLGVVADINGNEIYDNDYHDADYDVADAYSGNANCCNDNENFNDNDDNDNDRNANNGNANDVNDNDCNYNDAQEKAHSVECSYGSSLQPLNGQGTGNADVDYEDDEDYEDYDPEEEELEEAVKLTSDKKPVLIYVPRADGPPPTDHEIVGLKELRGKMIRHEVMLAKDEVDISEGTAEAFNEDTCFTELHSDIEFLEDKIGNEPDAFCGNCFHLGHCQFDAQICPSARVRALLAGNGSFYFYDSLELVRQLVMFDVAQLSNAVNWGVQVAAMGHAAEIGITPFVIRNVGQIVKDFFLALKANKILSFHGDENKELQVTMEDLVYAKMEPADALNASYVPHLSKPPVEVTTTKKRGTRVSRPRPAKKIDVNTVAHKLELPSLGSRDKTICPRCYFPGHVKSSKNRCPVLLVQDSIEAAKTKKGAMSRLDKVEEQVERLRVVLGAIEVDDERYEDILTLVQEWEELVDENGEHQTMAKSPKDATAHSIPSPKDSVTDSSLDGALFGDESEDPFTGVASKPVPPTRALPLELEWRQKSPLDVIGRRPDSLCKRCLHHGHDKRALACPMHLVGEAFKKNTEAALNGVNGSIEQLNAAIEWQLQLPMNLRNDVSEIENVINKWEHLITHPEELDPEPAPPAKRQRKNSIPKKPQTGAGSSKNSRLPAFERSQSVKTSSAPVASPEITPAVTSPEIIPVVTSQTSSPASETSTKSGIFVDHSNMSDELMVKIVPFVLDEDEHTDDLRITFRGMPASLVRELLPYMSKPAAQPAAGQMKRKRV
ncbi:hypothetical protein RUND412_002160 [Rhizina undulata]